MDAEARIDAGVCGFHTVVTAKSENGRICRLTIESDCPNVRRLAAELHEVDGYAQVAYGRGRPTVHELADVHLQHAACPVPSGIIKAIEVACGLALPADVSISVSKTDGAT